MSTVRYRDTIFIKINLHNHILSKLNVISFLLDPSLIFINDHVLRTLGWSLNSVLHSRSYAINMG